jgi:hypothetical protein
LQINQSKTRHPVGLTVRKAAVMVKVLREWRRISVTYLDQFGARGASFPPERGRRVAVARPPTVTMADDDMGQA